MNTDIVRFMLDLVRQAEPSIKPEKLIEIEQRVRREMGAWRHYVRKNGVGDHRCVRPQSIAAAAVAGRGVPVVQVVDQTGVSRTTIYRLLKDSQTTTPGRRKADKRNAAQLDLLFPEG